jgi:hypothetical protein
MPRKLSTSTGHRCGPGCATLRGPLWPEVGSPHGFATWAEGRAAYQHHRDQVLAARYNPGHRHAWWWMFSERAAPWRNDPQRWDWPEDLAYYDRGAGPPDAAGERPGLPPYYLRQLARLRFLAASRQLRGPEVAVILARVGRDPSARARHEARAVKEGLAMLPPPQGGAAMLPPPQGGAA